MFRTGNATNHKGQRQRNRQGQSERDVMRHTRRDIAKNERDRALQTRNKRIKEAEAREQTEIKQTTKQIRKTQSHETTMNDLNNKAKKERAT